MKKNTADLLIHAMASDLIVAVMHAALVTTRDEKVAAGIASRARVNILERVAPGTARELVKAFGDQTVH